MLIDHVCGMFFAGSQSAVCDPAGNLQVKYIMYMQQYELHHPPAAAGHCK